MDFHALGKYSTSRNLSEDVVCELIICMSIPCIEKRRNGILILSICYCEGLSSPWRWPRSGRDHPVTTWDNQVLPVRWSWRRIRTDLRGWASAYIIKCCSTVIEICGTFVLPDPLTLRGALQISPDAGYQSLQVLASQRAQP